MPMTDDSTRSAATLRHRLNRPDLWDFALAFYAQPEVEAACLTLQDEAGVDVCELLWHCWLHRHGLGLTCAPTGLAAVRQWQAETTRPLRRLRRALKAEAQEAPGVAEVRRHIKQAELAAERETLGRLQRLSEANPELIACSPPSLSLQNYLAKALKVQEKNHLLLLKTLENHLDPPQPPR